MALFFGKTPYFTYLVVKSDILDMSKTAKNPFLFSPIHTIKIREEYQTVSTSSGRVVETTIREYEVDQHQSVSLYKIDEIINAHRLLTKAGMHLFLYIIGNIVRKEKDIIELTHDEHSMEISRRTYFRAIEELLEHSFIARKTNGVYWINPHIFFSGRRPKALIEKYGESVTEIKTVINR